MRMAGPDIVLFVVGALLFGGATYAIVSTDGLGGSASALGVFQVTYSARTIEIGTIDVASMRSATEDFEVDEPGVTKVVVDVTCTDPLPVAFSISVAVKGPNGQTGEGAGSCTVPVEIEFPIATIPADTTVAASTEDEARANLAGPENNTANGLWTVTVSGTRGQQPVPIPVADPAGTIALSVEVAQPRFSPVQR